MAFNVMKLKELVKRKKFSHKELGQMLDVSDRTVLNYLTSKTKIDVDTASKFANILNVPVSYFFDEQNSSNSDCTKQLAERDAKIKELQQRVKSLEFAFETMKLSLQQIDNRFAEDIMKTIEKYLEE